VSVEDEILAISAAWDVALIGNDADEVASFMADDWVSIDANGTTSKADVVGWIRSGRLRHDVMQATGDPRIAVHGSTAVLTARKASAGAWDGQTYAVVEWISEVYAREDGRWICVLSQKTPAG